MLCSLCRHSKMYYNLHKNYVICETWQVTQGDPQTI